MRNFLGIVLSADIARRREGFLFCVGHEALNLFSLVIGSFPSPGQSP